MSGDWYVCYITKNKKCGGHQMRPKERPKKNKIVNLSN